MANRDYDVTDSFELIGAFWDSSEPDQRITGTLSSKKGRLRLLSAPIYGTPNIDEFNSSGAPGDAPRTEGLCGFTGDGNCSLLAAVRLNVNGLTDFSTNQKVTSDDYRVSAAVMGLHVKSLDYKCIDSAAFYFTKIHSILPVPWGMEWKEEGNTFIAPRKAVNVFTLRSLCLQAEVIFEVFAGGGTKSGKEAS